MRFVFKPTKISVEVGKSSNEGCIVNIFVNRIAGVGASLLMATSIVSAAVEDFNPATSYGKDCYTIVAAHAGGMKSIEASKAESADKQVTAVSNEFKQIMSASDQARRCYLKLMSAEESELYQDELKVGAFKAGVIFEKAQAEFSGWIDEMSVVLLEDMAPAAGEGTEADLAAEAQMEAGMEMLIDSYMLLENAEALGAKMSRLGGRS